MSGDVWPDERQHLAPRRRLRDDLDVGLLGQCEPDALDQETMVVGNQ